MAEKVKNKKGKKRKVGRVFLVIGIILSMALGSMAAVAKYKADGILSLVNQDKDNALNSVDISEYDTVSDSDVINILLVGADKNLDEQDSEGAARRSDSMMIATLDMKHKKLKGALAELCDPWPIWAPINIIGYIAVPVSLSLRLFANVLSGVVMMALVYGLLRVIAIGWPAVLHVYFDLFSGAIQTYVFCMLTMVYVNDKME